MNKKQLIQTIKTEVKWYAQPRNMSSRTLSELEDLLIKARQLGLVNK